MTFLALLVSLFRRRPAPLPPVAPPVVSPAPADVPTALLVAHNAARAAAGLAPLVLDSTLCAAAQGHARQMARYGVAHDGIGDGTPEQRIKESGYMFREASENVAMGQRDAAAAVGDWMSDPPHRANVLGPYRHLGGGMATSKSGMNFWCCDYGSPA
jgi:uncharacterized protein YkwD